MVERTPEQWLDLLAADMDARSTEVARRRLYVSGQPPMPEMGKNLRASWEAFQRKARTNWAGLVVRSMANRIIWSGVTVGGAIDTPDAELASRIARDNRLGVAVEDAVFDALSTGHGYLVVGQGTDGRAVITAEPPESTITVSDEIHRWKSVAALKVSRPDHQDVDKATLWLPNMVYHWQRARSYGGIISSMNRGGWVLVAEEPHNFGVPVFHLDDGDGQISEHMDLIDRINLGMLWRLVIASMQAFRQRAVVSDKDGDGLPEKDEEGNEIDWGEILAPAPGALWELPAGISIWESQQTDSRPLGDSIKDDVRELAVVTGTPIFIMLPDASNQSASGADGAKDELSAKASKFIRRQAATVEGAVLAAMRVEGVEPDTIAVEFEPPDRVTLSEKADAALKMQPLMSLKTLQKKYLGWSPSEIAADEAQKRREGVQQMMASLSVPAPAAAPQAPVQDAQTPQQQASAA